MSIGQSDRTKFDYDDYCLFPNDGNRHEVIDGDHYMNPAPSSEHQDVSALLMYELHARIRVPKLGKVFAAPIDVQLGDFDIVQPDLIVVMNTSQAKIIPSRVVGPPDVVVEILSPSTAKNDQSLKYKLYERSGVKEYWVVDPMKRLLTRSLLQDGRYVEQPDATTFRLSFAADVKIDVSEIR